MAGKFFERIFSPGGDDSKASDKDNDDGAICCTTPLPNRKGGSWLSAEVRRGISPVVWPFNSPGRRATNFFFTRCKLSAWGSCSNSEIEGEPNMEDESAEGVGSGVGDCK